MGMDLVPRHTEAERLHYNWSGWEWMSKLAGTVDVQLAGCNDGEWLSAADCRKIAKAIEAHADEYNEAFGGAPEPMGYGDAPAKAHAEAWRKSGGWRQL